MPTDVELAGLEWTIELRSIEGVRPRGEFSHQVSLHRGEGLLNRPVVLFVGFDRPPRERRISAMPDEHSTAPCLRRAVIGGVEYVRLEVVLGEHSSWLLLQLEQIEL